MAIPETQLDTWSKQGSVTQSQDTYATMRNALDGADASYAGKSYKIFLQGSYGNDTNIYADSDVDVVIRMDDIYYFGLTDLSEEDRAIFDAARTAGGYSFNEFRTDVTTQLVRKFGSDVKPQKKAILVQGNGSRRDTDVLPCVLYRKYTRFRSWSDQTYVEGITFWTTDGLQIINYPKLHSANCTTKHQETGSWFKPAVRIIKNMRNAMVADGYIKEGDAPSYFLEGMLWNVPNTEFGTNYQNTIIKVLNWLIQCERDKLVCANRQFYLCHPTSAVTWRAEKRDAFIDAAVRYWNNW